MNGGYLIRRFLGKPTCILGKRSRILGSAKILNSRNSSEFIRLGEQTIVAGELFVAQSGSIEVGDWGFVGPGTRIWSSEMIRIGHRVLISHNVNIFDSLTHPISPSERHAHFKLIATIGHPLNVKLDGHPIKIEDDVWIGAGSSVLRGVTIGRGAIVGAGAVVTNDIAEYSIVGGNPASVIRVLRPDERS
jgi:acetyltransferase-like isoleucine patch superfamily enzyme